MLDFLEYFIFLFSGFFIFLYGMLEYFLKLFFMTLFLLLFQKILFSGMGLVFVHAAATPRNTNSFCDSISL